MLPSPYGNENCERAFVGEWRKLPYEVRPMAVIDHYEPVCVVRDVLGVCVACAHRYVPSIVTGVRARGGEGQTYNQQARCLCWPVCVHHFRGLGPLQV